MADENLKDFAISWTILALLVFSLITFAITYMYDNNPIGLNDGTEEILGSTESDMESELTEVEGETNTLLNITSKTNPEKSFLGSRDSVATAYDVAGSAKTSWSNIKNLLGWVFSGEAGKILLGTISGLVGFLMIYFVTKWIRIGS
jgi:hypothetical protein